ncbi:hypothetical protein BV898_12998 [Hypsibius exemplaris]|uniref:Ig-like domain-containing protein n=1 Tax=Hypsibius exemplaris TaxID=2072580 RepID=A0A1W0WC43_HYPEX|nr:hypothetical protein BV898_12998 [Hypsibius exemplaris]
MWRENGVLAVISGLLWHCRSAGTMRNTVTTQDACRPNAFTYCELPIITSLSEQPYPAFPGEELKVLCQAYGSPVPLIAWYRVLANGESIDIPTTEGSHMINEAGLLRIRHVVPHDDGKYFCMASNSVGESKYLIEIKVSHPMVSLIPLSIGDTFVTLTWNGSVHITAKKDHKTTHASVRHRHHVEARFRLSRHLLLKYRRYKESLLTLSVTTTTTIKLIPTARQYGVHGLQPNTAYEFCIEFQPTDRPTTLLDCLVLRTTTEDASADASGGMGYHQGHTILFVFLIAIVGGVSSLCFGCYTYAVGRKLWKYRQKKSRLPVFAYGNDGCVEEEDHYPEHYNNYSYYGESNPTKPLIARI